MKTTLILLLAIVNFTHLITQLDWFTFEAVIYLLHFSAVIFVEDIAEELLGNDMNMLLV